MKIVKMKSFCYVVTQKPETAAEFVECLIFKPFHEISSLAAETKLKIINYFINVAILFRAY